MSTLNLHSNPFLQSYKLFDSPMPTTVTHIPRTCSPSPTLSLERKRKLDGDLLTTPVRPNSEDNALVTPPRSTKRSKTTPSSPIRDHHLYETPKTPSQKQQFNINLNARSPNYNYAITNPHNYSSVSLNSNGTTEVTPPQSQEVSPRLDTIQLAQPSVTPLRGRYYGEFMYSYPDTCYPFNINSSAIGRSDGNLRAATWRSACNEKIRHEFNKSAKEYAALSEKYKKDTEELKKQGSLNLPSIYDTKIFPSFNSINDTVNRGLNYFSYNASSRFSTDAQQEARSLLELRNASRDKPASTNHSTKTCNIQLPPIREILKLTPFDKSRIHPSCLTSHELQQYNDRNSAGILFEDNAYQFHNGREIKTGNSYAYRELTSKSNSNQPLSLDLRSSYHRPMNYFPTPNQSTIIRPPTESLINESLKSQNNCPALASKGEDSNNLVTTTDFKHYQTKFKSQPLKIKKTRRNSVSKVTKNSGSKNSCKHTPVSSRSSSRKSSSSSNRSASDQSTAVKRRTRQNPSTRSSSIESVRTTEVPVSVQSTPLPRLASRDDHNLTPLLATPEAQPTPQISTRTTEEIQRHSFLPHTHLPRMHTTQQLDDVNVSVTPMKAQLSCSHHFHENINKSIGDDDKIPGKNLQSAYRLSKVCMSCHSNQSPCWRPSWSPDEGQLCNSCGLRYRKTKARCYNPKCLKIPSKSEWALMMKRGKVLLDVYHEDGSVAGKQLSYRCLDCDSAMEVLR